MEFFGQAVRVNL